MTRTKLDPGALTTLGLMEESREQAADCRVC